MYSAKDYREKAWSSLKGRWGIVAVAELIYTLIIGAADGLSYYGIGALAVILLGGPLALGINKIALNVSRDEDADIATLFDGFKDFTRSLVLYITNNILIVLWTLLLIIPGIIKSLSYSMSYFILLDNPDMSANDARKESMEMMDGNKGRLFCLYLSYIGWYLLSILTFGILLFWVGPSVRTATAFFYQSLLPEVEVKDGAESEDFDSDVFDSNSVNNDDVPFVSDVTLDVEDDTNDIII